MSNVVTPQRIAIGVIGVGKIARDQHVPALRADPRFDLLATASLAGTLPDVPGYIGLDAMLAAHPRIAAVALCTPPAARTAIARAALEAGRHVLIEKPPGATVSEVEDLAALARARDLALFAAWHSRHAPGVAPARFWLAGRQIRTVSIVWKEDVRRWHPGQDWIWEPGGFGVFDPGINALSIATALLPERLIVTGARLVVPANRQAPIAAELTMRHGTAPVTAAFDWRQQGDQIWTITVETDAGMLELARGGAALSIGGRAVPLASPAEYASVYDRFATLIAERAVDADINPLLLVADAHLLGARESAAPFC